MVLRAPHQMSAALAMGGTIAAALVKTAVDGTQPWVVTAIEIIVVGTYFGRLGAAAVVTHPDEVVLRNLVCSTTIPWRAIDAFSIGRSGLESAVCRVHLADGSVRRAIGIRGRDPGAGELVAALNVRLRERLGDCVAEPRNRRGGVILARRRRSPRRLSHRP